MQVTFAHGIGDKVTVKARSDARGRVRGLFVGEDERKQVSVAYVSEAGDPMGPEWFGEGDLEGAR